MNKTTFSHFFKGAQTMTAKHSPEILMGVGIANLLATTVIAVANTPKALRRIEEVKKEKHKDKLTVGETIKATWKCYLVPVATGFTGTMCLIGSSKISNRRNAALAAAYKISETALIEYKDKVVETIGEKKEEAIRESIIQDHIDKNPPRSNEIIVTGDGTTRCYDVFSGRYFQSSRDRIEKAIANLNKQLVVDDYVSLNELYDELGIPHTTLGSELGWRVIDGWIDVSFSSHLADDGIPALAIHYSIAPCREYYTYS